MTDLSTPLPPRRRKTHARSRRRVDLRRLRRHRESWREPQITPAAALHILMRDGDVYRVGRSRYLVAPINADVLDVLIIASGSTEDDEPNGDLEPSIGSEDDLEDDGLTGPYQGEGSLGWANEGDQSQPSPNISGEDEWELGWSNTGPQLRLHGSGESDGDCDAEDDDPGEDDDARENDDPGEPSLCGSGMGGDTSDLEEPGYPRGQDAAIVAAARLRYRKRFAATIPGMPWRRR